MHFSVAMAFFVILVSAGISYFLFPFMNLHMANANVAMVRTKVNEIINENRNTPYELVSDIKENISKNEAFDLVSVTSAQANDFRLIEVEFHYKTLFQGLNKKLGNQKMRFIVNDV